jgi:Mor family transcriptional regulator
MAKVKAFSKGQVIEIVSQIEKGITITDLARKYHTNTDCLFQIWKLYLQELKHRS